MNKHGEITGKGAERQCWCELCKTAHHLYYANSVWLLYNCPYFLSYHHLQTYFKNPKNLSAKDLVFSKYYKEPTKKKKKKNLEPFAYKVGDLIVFKDKSLGEYGTIEQIY